MNKVKVISLQDVNSDDLYDYLSNVENGEKKLKSLYKEGLDAIDSSYTKGKYHLI